MKDKIVTFGEIMLRLSKPDHRRLFQGNVFSGDYGGSEANVAISLAQLGDNVEFVTRVPDNAMGHAALLHLQQYGLDTSHIVRGGERLGTYYFESAAAMRNSKVVYDRKDSSFYSLKRGDIPWSDIFVDAAVMHCSGITCATSQDACDTTMDAVRTADEMGVEVTCDINYRKNLWRYPGADAPRTLHQLMEHAQFIFGDQDEWEVSTGVKKIPFDAVDSQGVIDIDAYRRYFDIVHKGLPRCRQMYIGLRNQLTTNHHTLSGVLWSDGEVYTTRIYDIRNIIDAMGVGDAFCSGFLHARRHFFLDGDHSRIDSQRCLDFALASATIKNSVPGDQNLVSEEEILDVMNME